MSEIRVISVVVDKKNAVLYLEDASTITLKQEDYRLKDLIDQILPIVNRGEVAVVNLETFNAFADFEKKSNGLIRFLKIAKEKVKHFFMSEEEQSNTRDVYAAPRLTPAEVIEQAQVLPETEEVESHETVIAVTAEGKILPEADKLKDIVAHSVKTGNTKGLTRLIERATAIIDKRGHSVKDLVTFLEKSDMPIADDGSIIGYKMLNYKDKEAGIFVDCHSGNVLQKVGSYVVVDESMVDKNRNNECSNGLHIARRSYLRSFGGDVCVIVKLAPEDLITVPHGDPNKVRVCAYHIIGVLSDEGKHTLRQDKSITHLKEDANIIAQALTGKHIGKLEEVRITKPMGGGLIITKLAEDGTPIASVTEEEVSSTKAVDSAGISKGEAVDPKELNKRLAEEDKKLETAAVKAVEKALDKPKTNAEKARDAFNAKDYPTVAAIKAKAKVSYTKLGFAPDELITITDALESKSEPQTKATAPKQAKPAKVADKPKDVVKKNVPMPASDAPAKEWANYYFVTENWSLLTNLKKAKKVGWAKLGFSETEIATIEKNIK